MDYGILTYINLKNQPNVAKYTSPMDAMGLDVVEEISYLVEHFLSHTEGVFQKVTCEQLPSQLRWWRFVLVEVFTVDLL